MTDTKLMAIEFKPVFKTVKCSTLSEEQLRECSTLYSGNYGFYSGKDDASKQGKHIKLSPNAYRRLGENPNMYVSCKAAWGHRGWL